MSDVVFSTSDMVFPMSNVAFADIRANRLANTWQQISVKCRVTRMCNSSLCFVCAKIAVRMAPLLKQITKCCSIL